MKEKYGFYKVYDESIKEIKEQINQNLQISIIGYKKDYEETIRIIKAFYVYKSFINDYVAKSVEKFINRQKLKYKYSMKINDSDNIIGLEFRVVAIPNNKLIYDKYGNILVNSYIFDEFCEYIRRMIIRQKFNIYNINSEYQSGRILGLDNEYDEYFHVSRFSIALSIKDLIDCYYNELQALELMEEEINILKEEYQIKDSELILKKQNT